MYVKRIVRHKFVLKSNLQIENPDRQTFLIAPLPIIDNEKHRAVKGYMWAVRNALTGDVYFHYEYGLLQRRYRTQTYRKLTSAPPSTFSALFMDGTASE